MKRNILFTLCLSLCMSLSAYDFHTMTANGNKLYFSILDHAERTVAVVNKDNDRLWAGELVYQDILPCYAGKIIIPHNVTYNNVTYQVVQIEACAFTNCFELTEVVLPNTIQNIGQYAFSLCTHLRSIDMPNYLVHIENNAFIGADLLVVNCSRNHQFSDKNGFWARDNKTVKYEYSVEEIEGNNTFHTHNVVQFQKGEGEYMQEVKATNIHKK